MTYLDSSRSLNLTTKKPLKCHQPPHSWSRKTSCKNWIWHEYCKNRTVVAVGNSMGMTSWNYPQNVRNVSNLEQSASHKSKDHTKVFLVKVCLVLSAFSPFTMNGSWCRKIGDGLLAQIKAVLYLKAACRCASWSLTALTTVMGKMKSKFNKGVDC